MKIKLLFLILLVLATDDNKNGLEKNAKSAEQSIVVKIEEDDYSRANQRSNIIGASYHKNKSKWFVVRQSKTTNKRVHNGSYNDEEAAAHASDTLARKLIANGEKGHKLNFPDEETEVHPKKSSNYLGVTYSEKLTKWRAQRRSKKKNKTVSNGYYKDEETTAHASDTLARILITNGEKGHKLNFPDDDTEVYPEETKASNYIGVTIQKRKWRAQRWSSKENRLRYNGTYKEEETAAHASDTLAKKLIASGEKGHKLNFPDNPGCQKKKRKRPYDFGKFQDNEFY